MGILSGYNVALITCKLVRLVTNEWLTPKTAQPRNNRRHHNLSRVTFFAVAHTKYHTVTFYGYTTNWKSDQLLGEACELRSFSFMACEAGEPPTRDFSGLHEMDSLLASQHRWFEHHTDIGKGLKSRFPGFLFACDCSSGVHDCDDL